MLFKAKKINTSIYRIFGFATSFVYIFYIFATTTLITACSLSNLSSQTQILQGAAVSGGTSAQYALAYANIGLYQLKGNSSVLVDSATADKNGRFSVQIPADSSDCVLFVVATLNENIRLVSLISAQSVNFVTINELTTVAASYTLAQLFDSAYQINTNTNLLQLKIALGMNDNIVNTQTGNSSSVLLSSPNADETNSLRLTRNLANLISSCIQSKSSLNALLDMVNIDGANVSNTFEALIYIAKNPALYTDEIFTKSKAYELFTPSLLEKPDAWTIAIKINNSGNPDMPFGGAANTVFDDRGYAWINNNVVQGTTGSSRNIIVLQPNGAPSNGLNNTPISPISSGGILGPGFGITRNLLDNTIWVGNFGWGGVLPGQSSPSNGSVSKFLLNGSPISPSTAYYGGTDRVQGIVADKNGNIWTASYGNNKIVVFINGDPSNTAEITIECKPFGLAVASDGSVWATTIGGSTQDCNQPSKVVHYKLDGANIVLLSSTQVGVELKGLDVDFNGYIWVASTGDNTVYRLDESGNVVASFSGGGIIAPWGIRIDDGDNVWVANFGPMDLPPNNIYQKASITVLAGPTSNSQKPIGTFLSPATGFTLPSSGSEVLLSDGTPLSQTGVNQPRFTPLMRTVSAVADMVGNVWVTNNWKPNYTTDIVENPGGDGVVIFVGLATPTKPGRTQ